MEEKKKKIIKVCLAIFWLGFALYIISAATGGVVHWAALEGNLAVVKMSIAMGADVNVVGPYGDTPLNSAVGGGYIEIVKELIAAGADVNAIGFNGYSPLDSAKRNGHDEIVEILKQAGARRNIG